ncbi:MAG TPA: SgcJ/EcaC family oxidoreductase [Rickettsiales bacterium]|nr:SgcJ/EcaC family oxidoreductase [Rickettsiales bacterium]
MEQDEIAIRQLVATWMEASKSGDVQTVLSLMTDDVVFMVPGAKPFGKEAFAAASQGMKSMKMDGKSEILELEVLGDWAYARSFIDMTVTPPNGDPIHRNGHTLTLFKKDVDGKWKLARDANMLTVVKG